MRDGVWLSDDPSCKVDEAKPAEKWPKCAEWSYIRGNESFKVQWSEEGTGRKRRRTFDEWAALEWLVMAAGVPIIGQSTNCPSASGKAAEPIDETEIGATPAPSPEASETAPENEPRSRYCYSGLRVITSDDKGEITKAEVWPVFCGPIPKDGGNVTDKPWPSLQLIGDNCTAESEAALREAARRSQNLWPPMSSHWVRDGYH